VGNLELGLLFGLRLTAPPNGLTGRARCWLCRVHDRCDSLRDADFDRGRFPGIGADCRHTRRRHTQRHRHTRDRDLRAGGVSDNECQPDGDHSSNSKHDDGWLGNRVCRGRLIYQWDLGWGLGRPIEHARQHRGDIVLSR
jgi:hypothetical protein